MTIALTVLGDGRGEYLEQVIPAARELLRGIDGPMLMVNDSGDSEYAKYLDATYTEFYRFHNDHRVGMAAGMRILFLAALYDPAVDYIFHLEEDMQITAPVDLTALQGVLEGDQRLAQMSLKRQALTPAEIDAGGFIQVEPERYTQRSYFVEHDVIFTFNPCLIPRRVAEYCVEHCHVGDENDFTTELKAIGCSMGIWGTIEEPPRVRHIGEHRSDGWRV